MQHAAITYDGTTGRAGNQRTPAGRLSARIGPSGAGTVGSGRSNGAGSGRSRSAGSDGPRGRWRAVGEVGPRAGSLGVVVHGVHLLDGGPGGGGRGGARSGCERMAMSAARLAPRDSRRNSGVECAKRGEAAFTGGKRGAGSTGFHSAARSATSSS